MHRNNILNQTVPVVGAQGAMAASDISPAESKCNYCEMTFPTLMGQQQHARHKHPVEYNAECHTKEPVSSQISYGASSRNVGLSILFISEFEERGVRKVTTGITGLWRPSVHSDVAF